MTSFWLRHVGQGQNEHSVSVPSKTNVLVIGGGFSGVSTAYWLCKNNITDVTVVERCNSLSAGATGRNGGHVWPGTESPLAELVEKLGEAQAIKLWQFSLYNLELVEKFVLENNINCEFRMNGSVVLAKKQGEEESSKSVEWQKIQRKYNFLKSKGLATEMELWDEHKCAKEMKNNLFWGGLYTKKAAQIWPAKLVWGMAEKSTEMGAKFYTSVEVLSVTQGADKNFIVKTSAGELHAKYVVYATNAYSSQLLPELTNVITPVRGQVIASSPLPKIFPFGYLTNFGFEYWNQQPDGKIVLGGMRWKSHDKEVGKIDDKTTNDDVSKGLHEFLKQLYPEYPDVAVEHEWTGIMGFSPDGRPIVGPVSSMENAFILAGFTGHGMPYVFGCAEAVAAMVAQTETGVEKISPKFPECLYASRFNNL